jgi:RNA polymerase sigma factor (sigma-70 family)
MLDVGSTDKQLLSHYVRERDPASFRNLVSRHGPAVYRVCRHVLGDEHEAEDAFQATFLLLVRKAPEIGDPEALGGWLRGVAYRVAIRARRQATRRRACEQARAELSQDKPVLPREESARELREVVGDELTRLPEDYRRPIALCYLDGLTHQEAARQLDWPVGTVKVRLVRGRRLLRERLQRRGMALGSGLLMMVQSSRRGGSAASPLVESTARAMSLAAAGRHTALTHEFARAWKLADQAGRLGLITGPGGLWAALVVVALSAALSVPVVRVLAGPPVPDVDPASVPSNLTDVLRVDCR